MVDKKYFSKSGKIMNRQQRVNITGTTMPYKNPVYKFEKIPQIGRFNGNDTFMFNASQIPDNAEYVDFSFNPNANQKVTSKVAGDDAEGGIQRQQQQSQPQQQGKRKNNRNKQKKVIEQARKNGNSAEVTREVQNNNNSNWNTNRKNKQQQQQLGYRFSNVGYNQRRNNCRGFMNNQREMCGGGFIEHHMIPTRFQNIPPMIPPMPPMLGHPMPPIPMGGPLPPPPYMRRNMPQLPIPSPQIPQLRMPCSNMMPPLLPFNNKLKKLNQKLNNSIGSNNKKHTKGKSTIKTLKNLVNQYPLDKPWVTDEIRKEHANKINIEERLKGNKDDELFAQFKIQRDKFVSLYEKAREEHLRKEAESVKAKDAKDKQTNNKKTAALNESSNANANINAKTNNNNENVINENKNIKNAISNKQLNKNVILNPDEMN